MTKTQRSRGYWDRINRLARFLAPSDNPDRDFSTILGSAEWPPDEFQDVMEFSKHASALADKQEEVWQIDRSEPTRPSWGSAEWSLLQDQIGFMAVRADVLERLADIKTHKRRG